jgi:hypothetical protein
MQNHQPLTPAEALKELQRLLKDDTDVVPEGWYTIKQLQALWDMSSAERLVRRAVAEGMAEMKKFRIDVGAFVKPVPHYKFHARPLASQPPAPMAPRMSKRLAS